MNIKSLVLVRCTVNQPLGRKETSYAQAKDRSVCTTSPPKPDLEEKEGYVAQGGGLHEKAT